MSNPTSSIYKELDFVELEQIVKKHLLTNEFDYKVLSGGMFNTTYLVTVLATGKKYVLRVGPVNRHLLLPFENNLMRAEEYFIKLCNDIEVPMSTVIACDTEHDIVDRDYMIVEFIESVPLLTVPLSVEEKAPIYRKVGEYASRIHSVTGNSFGRLSSIVDGKGFVKWSEYLQDEVAGFVKCLRTTDIFTEDKLQQIEQVYIKYADLLDEVTVPHLVHCDLWEGNILIDNENRLVAIIDADRAVFGDIDFELASEWMINDSFVKGYGTAVSADEKSVLRRKIYSLVYNLLDTYVCLAEYNNKQNSDNNKNSVLKLLEQLV